jgi:hypothetical protein
MKINVAKLFCLLTVFLLSSNVFVSYAGGFSESRKHSSTSKSKSRFSDLQIESNDDDVSIVNFLIEKDPFEDFELLAELNPDFSFDFDNLIVQSSYLTVYKPFDATAHKIPRWLWVRQIRI